MTDDLISRQKAIDAADAIIARDKSGNNNVVNAMIAWREYIKHLQPTQPERIKGRWIQKSQVPDTVRGYWATCSSCGRGSFGGGNFCRECGSDNRKEKEK